MRFGPGADTRILKSTCRQRNNLTFLCMLLTVSITAQSDRVCDSISKGQFFLHVVDMIRNVQFKLGLEKGPSINDSWRGVNRDTLGCPPPVTLFTHCNLHRRISAATSPTQPWVAIVALLHRRMLKINPTMTFSMSIYWTATIYRPIGNNRGTTHPE